MQIYTYPYPAEVLYKNRERGKVTKESIAAFEYPAGILYKNRTSGQVNKGPIATFEYTDPALLNHSCMIFGFRGIRYPHKIAGTVTVDGKPAIKKVLAFSRGTYRLLGSTESGADGKWEIKGMPPTKEREILILGLDDSGKYNADVADFLTAFGGIAATAEEAVAGG